MASRKPQVLNGARQKQVSANTGYFGGLSCPEITNTEFFKCVEITSQAALRKSLRRFLQLEDFHIIMVTHM